MTEAEELAVVMVTEEVYRHEDGVVAARFDSLCLTAYGRTEEEASANLRKLFNREIHYYREKGALEQFLSMMREKTGVEWYWASDYPDDRPDYEDTNEEPGSGRRSANGSSPRGEFVPVKPPLAA